MKANEFTRKINKLILERGRKLYDEGCVNYTEALLDSICFTVNVNGYLQVVTVETDDNNEIIDITCGCPYFEENHFCKHTAAAMYFYCDMHGITPDEKESNCVIIDDNGNIINTQNYDFKKNLPPDIKLGYIEDYNPEKKE